MNELMTIRQNAIGGQTIQTVNARDLHAFLEIRKDFSDWIKAQLEIFTQGVDYETFESLSSPEKGNAKARAQILKEYALTIECAKHISMMSRTEKGMEARNYFIECERKAKTPVDPMQVLSDPAAMRGLLLTYTEKVIALEDKVQEQAPKVAALDRIATHSEGSLCVTDAAKVLQLQPKVLFRWLDANDWIYRRAGGSGWIGHQPRLKSGVLEHKITTVSRSDGSEKVVEQVLVTAKGLAKLSEVRDFSLAA